MVPTTVSIPHRGPWGEACMYLGGVWSGPRCADTPRALAWRGFPTTKYGACMWVFSSHHVGPWPNSSAPQGFVSWYINPPSTASYIHFTSFLQPRWSATIAIYCRQPGTVDGIRPKNSASQNRWIKIYAVGTMQDMSSCTDGRSPAAPRFAMIQSGCWRFPSYWYWTV